MEDVIKIDFKETERMGLHWIYLAQDGTHRLTLLNTVMHLCVHRTKFLPESMCEGHDSVTDKLELPLESRVVSL